MALSEISKIFRQDIEFIAGADKVSALPKLFLPEIAFIGKSNVGKSSLINSICNRKDLARTSHTPGRTQQLNFFSVANKFTIVDLPGYGFAKVPKIVKERWHLLIDYYLKNRSNLKMVNILIDARHGIKEPDIEMIKKVQSYGQKIQIVYTKLDKIKHTNELADEIQENLTSFGISCKVIYTSSKNRDGAKELQYSLVNCFK